MKNILGVDGGASKTHALVADQEGHILGFGSAGCANHQSSSLEAALAEVRAAAEAAAAAAGLPPGSIEHGCFCLAGADLPEDYAMLAAALGKQNFARSVTVKNDTMAALRAGLSRHWGVVVVCGTGFNAAGRGRDGRELIFPGLGYISGDWGGGAQLAQEVIRLVMRAHDGRGDRTQLMELVLERLGAPSAEVLMRRLYFGEIDARERLELVPLLFEASEAGDEPARQLVARMGREVATTANTLLRRLSLQEEPTEVVLAGGVFKGVGSLLIDTVRAGVRQDAPNASVHRLRHAPVLGALMLALEATGCDPAGAAYRNLVGTLPDAIKIYP